MAAKIYIVPSSGKYEGKLLVFDTVESMTHIRNSKIPNHPVESINRSVADHRFREGAKIQMTGAISDNWNTTITEEPTPPFKTLVNKEQALTREKMSAEFPEGTTVNKVVNQILDKKTPRIEDFEAANEAEFDNEKRGPFWIAVADRLLKIEKDSLDIAIQKQLSQAGIRTNNYSQGDQINTITQARELLNDLEQNSILVTIVSRFEVYENMVITNFTNVLRNGPQRGAYWVSLTLDEQLLATTVRNPLVLDTASTEEASEVSAKGKKTPKQVDRNDPNFKKVLTIYEEQVTLVAKEDSKAYLPDENIRTKISKAPSPITEDENLEQAFNIYVNAGTDEDAARAQTEQFIRARLGTISAVVGK